MIFLQFAQGREHSQYCEQIRNLVGKEPTKHTQGTGNDVLGCWGCKARAGAKWENAFFHFPLLLRRCSFSFFVLFICSLTIIINIIIIAAATTYYWLPQLGIIRSPPPPPPPHLVKVRDATMEFLRVDGFIFGGHLYLYNSLVRRKVNVVEF